MSEWRRKRRGDDADCRWWFEDGEALGGDWNSVGCDIRRAMERLGRRLEGGQHGEIGASGRVRGKKFGAGR